jgi:antitoxin component YwqK of YwqJK toxin-antitoxin module
MKKLVLPFLLILILTNTLAAQEVFRKNDKYLLRSNGKPYTGVNKEYDDDNRLVSETTVREGILDGITTIYYPTGAPKEVHVYKDGKKEGTWKNWNEDGRQIAEAGFKDGKKDGFWYIWDDQGVKRYEMFYIGGEKKGTWVVWDEKGNVVSKMDFK